MKDREGHPELDTKAQRAALRKLDIPGILHSKCQEKTFSSLVIFKINVSSVYEVRKSQYVRDNLKDNIFSPPVLEV